VPKEEIKSTILSNPDSVAFARAINEVFDAWKTRHVDRLKGIAKGSSPADLITELSEDLLQAFAVETQNLASLPSLIDKYDVYQQLMSYWTDTMQDDVHMISTEGWRGASQLRLLEDKKSKEKADLKIGKLKYIADLIPPSLIMERFFAPEQRAIEALEREKQAIAQRKEELEEEHSGEEGLLEEVKNDKGNISKAGVKARLKEIQGDRDYSDEADVLKAYLALMDQESQASKEIRQAQRALDAAVAARYKTLSEDEVRTLVVDDKWLTTLSSAVQVETQNLASLLVGRIKELAERYAAPLPQIAEEVEALSARVDAHLENMGFAWK